MKTFFQLKIEIMQALYAEGGRHNGEQGYLYVGSEEYMTLRRGDGTVESLNMWHIQGRDDETFIGLKVVEVRKKSYLHVVIQRC